MSDLQLVDFNISVRGRSDRENICGSSDEAWQSGSFLDHICDHSGFIARCSHRCSRAVACTDHGRGRLRSRSHNRMLNRQRVRNLLLDSGDQTLRLRHCPVEERTVANGWLDDQIEVYSKRGVGRLSKADNELELVRAFVSLELRLRD
jgi:hypothetical protein